jgi:HK97 family phage prohead protease
MLTKALGDLIWRADAPAGSLQATFSRFHTVDRDGDLTLPSAFEDGQRVPLVWSHQWTQPVGDGTIRVLPDRAVFEGQFWTDTIDGEQAYKKVKRAGDLQEYSYGYIIRDAGPGTHDGQPVRVLKSLEILEVSPVLKGAGVNTGTEHIKSDATVDRWGWAPARSTAFSRAEWDRIRADVAGWRATAERDDVKRRRLEAILGRPLARLPEYMR